jgi:hypothetical protein
MNSSNAEVESSPEALFHFFFDHEPQWLCLTGYPLSPRLKIGKDDHHLLNVKLAYDVFTKCNLARRDFIVQCDTCTHYSDGKLERCICGGNWQLVWNNLSL